jgi:nucleoside-diphosphate-sugar epimerase
MKVFLAGGTGFIGRHLVRRMAQTDHQLRCLARPTSDVSLLKDLGEENHQRALVPLCLCG